MTNANSTQPPPTSASASAVVVGIDIGALTTKIVLGPTHDHELVRDAHGGHATSTAVTFSGPHRPRLLGEDAADPSRADGNTVGMLDRLLPGSLSSGGAAEEEGGGDDDDALAAFRRFKVTTTNDGDDDDKDGGGGASTTTQEPGVYVPSMDATYSATALMAMLLGRARRNVESTVARLEGSSSSDETQKLHIVFAVPPSYPPSAREALADAAYAAGMTSSSTVDSSRCLAAAYDKKFGEAKEKKVVLVVEMGHARCCVTILGKGEKNEEGATDDDGGENNNDSKGEKEEYEVQVLSTVSSPALGAGLVDIALFRHFASTHPSLSAQPPSTFAAGSRPAQRLLEGCCKLKHLLSMLPDNTVTVENVGANEGDVNLSCNRDMLKELCRTTVVDPLKAAICTAIEKAGGMETLGEIDAVEISGGGSRMPVVQEAIREAAGKGEDFVLARSFDDGSSAFGASLIGGGSAVAAPDSGDGDAEMADAADGRRDVRRARLREAERAMRLADERLVRKDEMRNSIEAHVLELRSARHSSKHGSLLPATDEFTSFLDETDDWLFSDECDTSTVEEMEKRWDMVRERTREMCGEYLAAKEGEARQMEREMEEGARLAAAERAMEGEDGEEEDHDTRRLPTKRRMEIVMKNKNEANELFSGGNYRHAAARYAKALTHCSKFFDLNPEEEAEVKEVKVSLNLNMALAYIKLEKLENANRCCNDVLDMDATNVKALYRRATVLYQKRKFDDAVKDLKEAERLAPEDKAVKKLRRLVDQQVAKQKKKEKAMAKKMFG